MQDLASRVIRKLRERRFTRAMRAVLATPPVVPRDDGVILFSMIGTRVLLPYLVAIKSLHARLGRGRIVILDDGSLTESDRAVLAAQLGDPEIRSIHAVDTGPCPRGGTWERLLTILDLRRQAYVIQLDSDTVTTGPLTEVSAAIAADISGSMPNPPSSAVAAATAAQPQATGGKSSRRHGDSHVVSLLWAQRPFLVSLVRARGRGACRRPNTA